MTYDKHDCDLMCEQLAAYLEGDLAPADQGTAEQHLAECASCGAVLAELRAISSGAATLPLLTPSRDLWSGIESRITTPVTSFASAPSVARPVPRRTWGLAIAAAALIAVSAGTTYLVATHGGGTAAPAITVAQQPVAQQPVAQQPVAQQPVAQQPPTQHRDSLDGASASIVPAPRVATTQAPAAKATLASRSKKELSAARVYDNEITMLDSVVRTRRESLDPRTVAIIEQNLRIINKAITESRAALAKDPKSPLLSNQLDNVLGSKVELLRTVAFLPSQS